MPGCGVRKLSPAAAPAQSSARQPAAVAGSELRSPVALQQNLREPPGRRRPCRARAQARRRSGRRRRHRRCTKRRPALRPLGPGAPASPLHQDVPGSLQSSARRHLFSAPRPLGPGAAWPTQPGLSASGLANSTVPAAETLEAAAETSSSQDHLYDCIPSFFIFIASF